MSEPILYQAQDGRTRISLRAEDGSAWLSQAEMAELFATTKQNISLHVRNELEGLARRFSCQGILDNCR